jgi:hypothetical protein
MSPFNHGKAAKLLCIEEGRYSMHELRRMAYLEALGVDSYVSRQQLPGAAVTQRLAIVRQRAPSIAQPQSQPVQATPVPPVSSPSFPVVDTSSSSPAEIRTPPVSSPQGAGAADIRLGFCAMAVGDLLWLERLDGRPLASEQVALERAMAHALAVARGVGSAMSQGTPPEIAHFNWPMHNNQQLDNSAEAAKASLAAFLSRRTEKQGCQHLVVLGKGCEQWVLKDALTMSVVQTASTREMLENPGIKAQVWRDLKSLST